jgi:MFS family permease
MPEAAPTNSLLKHPDFMRLWSAQTISQVGSQISRLAVPLAAVIALHASVLEVAALTTADVLPFLLFALPAGVWIDRLPRRPVLIIADLGRSALLLSIPAAYAVGLLSIAHLYVVAFAGGVLTLFFDVAYQSYLPSLIGRDRLLDGNAKLELTRSAAQMMGPGLAGALIAVASAPIAILADAISFVASGGLILLIRTHEQRPATATAARPRMRYELAEGLRFVLGSPYLRAIALFTASSNFFVSIIFSIYLVYAVRELRLTPEMIGLIFALGNAGLVLGALFARRMGSRFGVGRTILTSAILAGCPLLLIPIAEPSSALPILIAAQLPFSFSVSVYNIMQVSFRQAICPDGMLGRMNATMRFMVWGSLPLGAIVGGALGSTIGLHSTLWVGAIGATVAFIVVLFSPVRSLEQMPTRGPDGAAIVRPAQA